MTNTHLLALAGAAAVALIGVDPRAEASTLTVTVSVDGTDNIYFDNWGSANNGLSVDVTGRGTPASAVSDGSGPINFADLGPLLTVATGSVVDAGPSATGPDGLSAMWNGLRVYSLIGVWSSTSAFVTGIGDSFFVGSSATLDVPTGPAAYLFLGENDGIFSDNSGAYSVEVTYMAPIPLAAAAPMLAAGLGLLVLAGRARPA